MGADTGINWTDATWNPIRGCSRVSEGCRNCYAERVAARFSKKGQPYHGLAVMRTSKLAVTNEGGSPHWTGDVRFIPEHLADPLRWKKPRRIFVNSMSDLFHESLTNEQIAAVFGVMAASPRHTFQVLTKRAKRMREWFAWVDTTQRSGHAMLCTAAAWELLGDWRGNGAICWEEGGFAEPWPLPNVWIGVSVENQAAAWVRIPDLLATPAAVRFLSCEPLLGPVGLKAVGSFRGEDLSALEEVVGHVNRPAIDWVIIGCESGPGARPCATEWIRLIRDQCAEARVPIWLKQAVATRDVPSPLGTIQPSVKAGEGSKLKPGGIVDLPYLDGRQHHEFPRVPSIMPVA